ncbi:hypothetical protein [Breoghania sp.]|nr:hypothetical protein [Breoghania sp.]MDJ0931036.1 hypothetical protein [Breoghania sp.]
MNRADDDEARRRTLTLRKSCAPAASLTMPDLPDRSWEMNSGAS